MKSVILTGPKHSGKTTVGKVLASLMSCNFIDLDKEIEKRTGKTPRQLYIEGEKIFQNSEVDSLCLFTSVKNKFVLATGGGIIDNSEAVSLLKDIDAIKVYLNISADTAWKRISAEGKLTVQQLPPFLQTDNPQETHFNLHERRAAAYRQLADIIIDVNEKTPKKIAEEIYKKYLHKL